MTRQRYKLNLRNSLFWEEKFRAMEQFGFTLSPRSFRSCLFPVIFIFQFLHPAYGNFIFYHLQNLIGKASHSLDGWVTILLVYVMKGDDRNLIGLADLFY